MVSDAVLAGLVDEAALAVRQGRVEDALGVLARLKRALRSPLPGEPVVLDEARRELLARLSDERFGKARCFS